MNKVLLASVIASSMFVGATAFAYNGTSQSTEGFYGSLMGGIAHVPELKFKGKDDGQNVTAKIDSKLGYNFGYAMGYRMDNMRLEGALSYIETKEDKIKVEGGSLSANDRIRLMPLMFNGYYDFYQVSPIITPYLGAGLGGVRYEQKDVKSAAVYSWAYQLIAGATYHVNNDWAVSLDYRFFNAPKVKDSGEKINYKAHLVNLSVSYLFG